MTSFSEDYLLKILFIHKLEFLYGSRSDSCNCIHFALVTFSLGLIFETLSAHSILVYIAGFLQWAVSWSLSVSVRTALKDYCLSLSGSRRQWHSTPVLLPGKSHGRRSLVGCSPWGREESDMTERLHFHFSLFTFMHWRRKWQPTPVFLPGESQGAGSLVGCLLWGRTESDTTEAT